ncbi:MAG: enoyl-CoA hydratase/isomerase family protein [bacterium]|nr:enoyl-CoA hydratase/isomerase family protein [bacterium]
MSANDDFFYENAVLTTYVEQDIAVIKLKCDVFSAITDLAESGKFISFFDIAERHPDIKALMLINEGSCYSEEEYGKFLQGLKEKEPGGDPDDVKPVFENLDRTRQINVLNRIITQLAEFKKITVVGLQENVVTPFFGASLAGDFRFASDDVTFSLAHLKYGIHPSGALPFFLPHYVGHGKAAEILLKGDDISAGEALKMGLITEIFPKPDFEKRCLQEIHKLCSLEQRVIHTTKLLLNFSQAALHNYFDTESSLIH